jgi:hypothetical protein
MVSRGVGVCFSCFFDMQEFKDKYNELIEAALSISLFTEVQEENQTLLFNSIKNGVIYYRLRNVVLGFLLSEFDKEIELYSTEFLPQITSSFDSVLFMKIVIKNEKGDYTEMIYHRDQPQILGVE